MGDTPNPTNRDDIFQRAVRGDAHALAFLNVVFHAADVADDLHDRDKPASVADLLHSLTSLNLMPFYQQHHGALTALMLTGSLAWDLSNELPPRLAQHYACGLEHVLFYVALVCGGYEHAKAIAREWIIDGDNDGRMD